jgi:hypothetical protein
MYAQFHLEVIYKIFFKKEDHLIFKNFGVKKLTVRNA